ncbi:TetR/AcrR family transcriptional regulator [Jeotgalibacillus aurantiacus]|uniref:TetR/AcrR family transcriptional regulator n=1 Tax=Jeotgalibacillus aurantiacus TaxID=2763266 RepID=UPI001D0A76C9|nr:TetR-like C-terminal domain-containing protein [Jeotgalibacillus aurantiacus]
MKQDLRVKKTKKAIHDALITLVKEKDFSRISVRDLCETAEINRGTFYLHYLDKFDLLEQLQQELLDRLWQIVTIRLTEKMHQLSSKPDILLLFATELFTYVDQEADTFYMLLVDAIDPSFQEKIKDLIKRNMLRLTDHETVSTAVPIDYVMAYVTSAAVGILQHWLQRGRTNPPEELARMIVQINLNGPMRMLNA